MEPSGKSIASVTGLLAIVAFGAWQYVRASPVPTPDAEPRGTSCSDGSGIDALFGVMKQKKTMDPSQPLLWGFFFLDDERSSLTKLQVELERQGYRAVGITDPPAHGDAYMLHVEKVERHSTESLRDRNSELCELARSFHIRSYDGWDVGETATLLPPTLRGAPNE